MGGRQEFSSHFWNILQWCILSMRCQESAFLDQEMLSTIMTARPLCPSPVARIMAGSMKQDRVLLSTSSGGGGSVLSVTLSWWIPANNHWLQSRKGFLVELFAGPGCLWDWHKDLWLGFYLLHFPSPMSLNRIDQRKMQIHQGELSRDFIAF